MAGFSLKLKNILKIFLNFLSSSNLTHINKDNNLSFTIEDNLSTLESR